MGVMTRKLESEGLPDVAYTLAKCKIVAHTQPKARDCRDKVAEAGSGKAEEKMIQKSSHAFSKKQTNQPPKATTLSAMPSTSAENRSWWLAVVLCICCSSEPNR